MVTFQLPILHLQSHTFVGTYTCTRDQYSMYQSYEWPYNSRAHAQRISRNVWYRWHTLYHIMLCTGIYRLSDTVTLRPAATRTLLLYRCIFVTPGVRCGPKRPHPRTSPRPTPRPSFAKYLIFNAITTARFRAANSKLRPLPRERPDVYPNPWKFGIYVRRYNASVNFAVWCIRLGSNIFSHIRKYEYLIFKNNMCIVLLFSFW